MGDVNIFYTIDFQKDDIMAHEGGKSIKNGVVELTFFVILVDGP